MNTFTLEKNNQCNNCQRLVLSGEQMTAPSLDVLNKGGGLCETCRPIEKPKAEAKETKKAK
jgi:hypothetical protein